MKVAQQATNLNPGTPTQETFPFEPCHAEYFNERAVDPVRAAEARLRSITAEGGAVLLGFDEPLSTGGLFTPYTNAPGYARIRLSEGKTRFLVPRDREVPIYIPPGCELEVSAPTCVTEGPIKALALQYHGFDAVAAIERAHHTFNSRQPSDAGPPLGKPRRLLRDGGDAVARAYAPMTSRPKCTRRCCLPAEGAGSA